MKLLLKILGILVFSIVLGIIWGQFGHSNLEAYTVGWLGGVFFNVFFPKSCD